jgi:glycosyltransferase involved in cell wall biosynthesis
LRREIGRRAGLPLRVAARIYPEERPYYEREIEPLLRASPWGEFVGKVGGAAKDAFLGNAYAVLFPIDWAEPFGLVMIEAMACGTPIVSWQGHDHRKNSRSHTSLLGAVHRAGHH